MARINTNNTVETVRKAVAVRQDVATPSIPVPGTASVMNETWYVLNKAAQHLRECVEAALLPLGLRRRHYVALSELLKGEPSQQELSERIPVDRATMVKIIDDLEGFGLAARRQDPDDRRAYQVVLLPAGEALVNEATKRVAAAEKVALANLSRSECELISSISQKILGWDHID